MVPGSEEEKASAARRKRDAYFAELAEEEKKPKAKKGRRGAGGGGSAKPIAAKKPSVVGLKKTSIVVMPGSGAGVSSLPTDPEKKEETDVRHTQGATITGIPPPPSVDDEGADYEEALTNHRFVRFTAPHGSNVDTHHARVQIRMGIHGTITGPVVEVELPKHMKQGDTVECAVPQWTQEDAPPPPPKGSAGFRGGAPPPPPPPGAMVGGDGGLFPGPPPGAPPPHGALRAPPPPPPHMVAMGGGVSAYGAGAVNVMRGVPPLPPVGALGTERGRPPMTLMRGPPMGMGGGGGAIGGGSTVEVPPPPPPKKR